jgi:plastocyanin
MSELHPHWHSDDDERIVHIRSASRASNTAPKGTARKAKTRTTRPFSRRPAAVTGILLALWAGFAVIRETGYLGAQLAPDHPVITIDEIGVNPTVVTVAPGQTVEWVNEDTIPHIITSDTLATTTDPMLETPTIFPGSSETVTIAPDAMAGSYTYISRTKQTITGVIVVASSSGELPQEPPTLLPPTTVTLPSPPPLQPSIAPAIVEPQNLGGESLTLMPPVPPTPPSASAVSDTLVQNPYAIQTQTRIPEYVATTVPAMQQGYQPLVQPQTGPALWIASIASVLLLIVITRKAFQKIS